MKKILLFFCTLIPLIAFSQQRTVTTQGGTTGYLLRFLGISVAGNSIIFDNGTNIGIGTTSPTSKLSIGASSQFQVNSTGNIVKINNVATSFPSSQGAANTVLSNDGSGNLSWTPGGSGSIKGVGTINYVPKWVSSDSLSATSSIFDNTSFLGVGINRSTTLPITEYGSRWEFYDSIAGQPTLSIVNPFSDTTARAGISVVGDSAGEFLTLFQHNKDFTMYQYPSMFKKKQSMIFSGGGNSNGLLVYARNGRIQFSTDHGDNPSVAHDDLVIADETGYVTINTGIPVGRIPFVNDKSNFVSSDYFDFDTVSNCVEVGRAQRALSTSAGGAGMIVEGNAGLNQSLTVANQVDNNSAAEFIIESDISGSKSAANFLKQAHNRTGTMFGSIPYANSLILNNSGVACDACSQNVFWGSRFIVTGHPSFTNTLGFMADPHGVLIDTIANLTTSNNPNALTVNGVSAFGKNTACDGSAIVEVSGTTGGFLPPRMTTTQRNAISSPAKGLITYDTSKDSLFLYRGSWSALGGAGASTNGWSLTGNSGTTAGTNFIGNTDSVDFVLETNNIERWRETANGRLGIGTNSPTGFITATGKQPASVSTSSGTSAATVGAIKLTASQGGSTTIATTGSGGVGGAITITAGLGGTAASAVTTSTYGTGGAVTINSGSGTNNSVASSSATNASGSGAITIATPAGGIASGGSNSNVGGDGGGLNITGGNGGNAGTASAGSGGVTATAGTANNIIITGGNGGAAKKSSSGAYGGNGANVIIYSGNGGAATDAATTNGGPAGDISLYAGSGGAGSTLAGTDGVVRISAGSNLEALDVYDTSVVIQSPLIYTGSTPVNGYFLKTNGYGLASWVPSPSPLTTKGDINVYSTLNTRLPVGTNGQVLVAASGATTGLSWTTLASGSTGPTGSAGASSLYSSTSLSITGGGTTTLTGGNNYYANSNATATTIAFSGFTDGQIMVIHYLKTTASTMTFTFPSTAVLSQSMTGAGIISGQTFAVTSGTSGRFTFQITYFANEPITNGGATPTYLINAIQDLY